MIALIVIHVIILVISCAETNDSKSINDDYKEWEQFKIKYKKFYEDLEEELRRKATYFINKKAIGLHNELYAKGLISYLQKLNEFADMTQHEFSLRPSGLLGYIPGEPHLIDDGSWQNVTKNVPAAIDWRDHNAVTPVKNQGPCGCCWAFSAVGSLEGQHALKSGQLVSLSEQNLLDCDSNPTTGNLGCGGGDIDAAFKYVIQNGGIDTETSYPYLGYESNCSFSSSNVGATANGIKQLPIGSESILKQVVGTIGPVSVTIDAHGSGFQFYSQGVYYNPLCNSTQQGANHGVLVVGYNTNVNGTDYWIVKNSWGVNWGNNGYIYMARNKNNNCGIASDASYPTVK